LTITEPGGGNRWGLIVARRYIAPPPPPILLAVAVTFSKIHLSKDLKVYLLILDIHAFGNLKFFKRFFSHCCLIFVELVFSEHKRTVNRIKFHPVESSLLLSAGQDGTMKCFVS
jgi:hypothetical protein